MHANPQILAVDDTETMRAFYRLLLTAQGYGVVTADDGVDALDKIGDARPDLVLLDLMMPRLDGIETCRRIKNDEATRDVKVVMCTSRSDYARISEAFAAGCDDYVVKPVDRMELLLKVGELLKFSHLRQLLRHG
jgi:two-component system cell cycle response regulator